jgi:pimeloyl-ACP methyl ester carboxylesterase
MNEPAYRASEDKLFAEYGVDVLEHRVDVPGTGAAVRVLELGTGKPTVFVHGSPNNAATWIPLSAQLPDRRCLLLERPGAGLSSPVESWADHRQTSVRVVTSVLDALGVERADVVGSSFGGLYAYNMALAQPERVGKVVIAGAPAGPRIIGMPKIFRFLSIPLPTFIVNKALRPDVSEARDMYVEIGHQVAVSTNAIPESVFEWYSALLCHTDTAQHLLSEVRAIATPFGYRSAAVIEDASLEDLHTSVLYLWGDEDPFASVEQGDRLADLSPNAHIEHFQSFGHILWYDDPALIAGRISAFLEGETV